MKSQKDIRKRVEDNARNSDLQEQGRHYSGGRSVQSSALCGGISDGHHEEQADKIGNDYHKIKLHRFFLLSEVRDGPEQNQLSG